MQTTLLGLAIALIIALVGALVGPYFIDWNQFRPQFEAEASRVIGAPVRVGGKLDARLLPAPSLQLRQVVVGGANDLGKVRADKLDVEFSLGSLMRGEWRATELTINGLALDLGLDRQGRIDWPATNGSFNLGSLAIDRLNLTGRIALHDAASHGTLELNDIVFSGDVRSLAGAVRGDGDVTVSGTRYPFRVSSGDSTDGSGTRVHLNIDPGARALAVDLEGVLSFQARAPRFEGALMLATPVKETGKASTGGDSQTPWKITAKVKADPSGAQFEQVEAGYGVEDRALKFAGLADASFGARPLLHAVLSARQLDADRFVARESDKDTDKNSDKNNAKDKTAEPIRLLPGLRALIAALPQLPIPVKIELSSEQIMLGGRPLQNLAAALHADAGSWTVDRLDFRAPGATQVSLSGSHAQAGSLKGALDVNSSDPDALTAWLQGRSEIAFRNQKQLHLHGDVSIAADRVALDAMQAEIDGGTVSGRIAFATPSAKDGSRFDAELKADRLDLDAATAFARSLAGPQGEWPDEALVSLDIGHAISAGQDLHPFAAKLGYGPKSITLDQLKIGDTGSLMLEGAGSFDRAGATGKLALNSTAASLDKITAALSGVIAPLAPTLATRLNALGAAPGPAHLKLALDVDKDPGHADRASAHAVLDLDAPQLTGNVTITANPAVAAIKAMDIDKIRRSQLSLETNLSSPQAGSLLALLGLDRAIVAADTPAQFHGSVTGVWGEPLRLKAKLSGTGLDAEADGSAESWAQETKANVNLKVRSMNLAPLFDLKPSEALAQNISLSSRIALAGNKLTLGDIDGALAGSRLRGHMIVNLGSDKAGDDKSIEGELGLDALDLAPAFALAVGSAGRDATEPLGSGLLKGWRGHIAFQALRGILPGGSELRPVSGTVKSDGQSLNFDTIKGTIGGGEAVASIDAKPGANGITLNANVQLKGVDGAALHYRGLAMPAGRASLQMTLAAQGRSASALMGAMSGNGTVTLDAAAISGLDPRAFEIAIHASDQGQATDDARLRQLVDPVLSAGALLVASAQIPFTIRDGRLRVAATTLDGGGARAVISGGYDIPADQADIRAALSLSTDESSTGRPEIQLFDVGSPDKLDRSVDVSALSSWLAVRAIDRETRRLDSIERGEPSQAVPASVPPPALPLPALAPPLAPSSDRPLSEVPVPGRDPRRIPLKPRVVAPRPVAPPAPASPAPPVVSQQVAPLPPPIEVRPAPSVLRPAPKPRPPLVLTPPIANPQ